MLRYILIFIGLISSFLLIRYREYVGDSIGEAEWMNKIGGVYNAVVLLGVFIFFWSLAELTGTNEVLFGFLKNLIPGLSPAPGSEPAIPF